MRLRWEALEAGAEAALADDLGVYTGDFRKGTWGVTTGKTNPISGKPYIKMFTIQGEAIQYARERAYKTGPLYLPKQPGQDRPDKNPKANVYYVVYMPEGQTTLDIRMRVLRGERGGLQYGPEGEPVGRLGRQGSVMVFDHKGLTAAGKIRWVLNKSWTVDVGDIEVKPRKPRARTRRK